jgi:hypothetical protein
MYGFDHARYDLCYVNGDQLGVDTTLAFVAFRSYSNFERLLLERGLHLFVAGRLGLADRALGAQFAGSRVDAGCEALPYSSSSLPLLGEKWF